MEYCPKCGREMDDKNGTGGHICYKTSGVRAIPIKDFCLSGNCDKLKQLRANLIKYGMHLDDCPCFIPQGKWADNDHHTKTDDELNIIEIDGVTTITVKCTCGFEQALKGE